MKLTETFSKINGLRDPKNRFKTLHGFQPLQESNRNTHPRSPSLPIGKGAGDGYSKIVFVEKGIFRVFVIV
jgi:hypothetical protein